MMDAPLRIAQPSGYRAAGVPNEGMAPIGVVPARNPGRLALLAEEGVA